MEGTGKSARKARRAAGKAGKARAGRGAPVVGLVVARFNEAITQRMEEAARAQAAREGLRVGPVARVFGVYDAPLAVKRLLSRASVAGVAVLGAVLEGGTFHDRVVAENAARAFVDLALAFEKPVTLGVIGPRASRAQAEKRAASYAKNAVRALRDLLL